MKTVWQSSLSVFFLSFSLLMPTYQNASAASCVSDWPENIFDGGYTGDALIGAKMIPGSNFQYIGGRRISIALSPQVSSAIESQIASLGKNIKVTRSWNVQNGLTTMLKTIPIYPSVSSYNHNLLDPSLSIPGLGQFNGLTNKGQAIAYEISPGVSLQTVITVSTPGCDARIFKSPFVLVPNSNIQNLQSSEIQEALKEISTDYTQLESLNKFVSSLHSQTLEIDKNYFIFPPGLPGHDSPSNIPPIYFVPDWRSCKFVRSNDNSFLNHDERLFNFADETKPFDCTIPLYGFFKGGVTILDNIHFHYRGTISEKVSSIKVDTQIICIKGKLTKVVSGINSKCPTGYKVKK
jgi:hypothetical protein